MPPPHSKRPMEKWKTAALLLVSAFAAYYLLLGGSTSIPTVISIPAEGGVLQNGPYSLTGEQPHIVVVGSGPTGQGAAWRLFELGYKNWTLVEGTKKTGGLAKSVVDENGFTWDHGVHVLFSHFNYFDSMMDMVLPKGEWYQHTRKSPAWMRGRFVGYPVQNNIWKLPKEDLMECLVGLTELHALIASGKASKPKNFAEWVDLSFGKGLAKHFMTPYNFKVWAHHTVDLNTEWVGERVATTDLNRVLKNLVEKKEDVSWGPNAIFRYPKHGSGHIWDEHWKTLPAAHLHTGKMMRRIEQSGAKKVAHFDDDTSLAFDAMISTIPVDRLLGMFDDKEFQSWSQDENRFLRQSVTLVGIGVWGKIKPSLNDTHWVYFPEEKFVFYRLTVLSNFSPEMVAKPGKQYSIVVEVSESKYRTVNHETLVDDVIAGLQESGFIPENPKFATKWTHRFEYGYPVPYVGRNGHMHAADDRLRQEWGIWSRGRFGSWKYEVANQDHSFMLGVQAVNNILFGSKEAAFRTPSVVNAALHQHKEDSVKPPASNMEPLDPSVPRFF